MNILPDGTLDYEDELLARARLGGGERAHGLRDERAAMTERMVAAIEHPLVDAIGHPTGRLIERRAPYARGPRGGLRGGREDGHAARDQRQPRPPRPLRDARARGGRRRGELVIDSDAHRPETLANMRWGVLTARRGWLTKAEVANTRPWAELKRLRKRARSAHADS